jgi:hypothetical protein
MLGKYLLPRLGQLPIEAVDERPVQEFVADLNRTELSPKSIHNVVGVLRLILGKNAGRIGTWSFQVFPRRNNGSLPKMRCEKLSIRHNRAAERSVCDDGRNRSSLRRGTRATR